MLELKEEVKGLNTTYPLLANDYLLKSQTVSDNSLHTMDGILKKKDLYVSNKKNG